MKKIISFKWINNDYEVIEEEFNGNIITLHYSIGSLGSEEIVGKISNLKILYEDEENET